MNEEQGSWTPFSIGEPPSNCLLALYRWVEEDYIWCSSKEVDYHLQHCKDITHWRVIFKAPEQRTA